MYSQNPEGGFILGNFPPSASVACATSCVSSCFRTSSILILLYRKFENKIMVRQYCLFIVNWVKLD